MDSDSLVEVVLPCEQETTASTERLCPPEGAAAVSAAACSHRPKAGRKGGPKRVTVLADDEDAADGDADGGERRGGGRCCWALLLVPGCSLLLTAALATLTIGALMAASCSVQSRFEMSCDAVRDNLIDSSSMDRLLPASSFKVLSDDASHVTMSHESPVNGAQYHVYFLLTATTNSSCTCLSLAASSIWFQPDDAGAGYCALEHIMGGMKVNATASSGPTCSTRALGICRPGLIGSWMASTTTSSSRTTSAREPTPTAASSPQVTSASTSGTPGRPPAAPPPP